MENVLGNLPGEIQWNIIKFMRHPMADAFHMISHEYFFDEDEGETFVFSWFRRKQFLDKIHDLNKMIADTPLRKMVKENAIRHVYNQMLRFYPD